MHAHSILWTHTYFHEHLQKTETSMTNLEIDKVSTQILPLWAPPEDKIGLKNLKIDEVITGYTKPYGYLKYSECSYHVISFTYVTYGI